jgi:hypothetical protein
MLRGAHVRGGVNIRQRVRRGGKERREWLAKRCNKYIKRLRCCGHRDNKRTNERPDRTCIIVLFLVIAMHNFNGYDGANDGEDDEEYDEANPALFACRSCRGDSFFRVAKTTRPVRTLPQQSKTRTHPVSTSFSTSVA